MRIKFANKVFVFFSQQNTNVFEFFDQNFFQKNEFEALIRVHRLQYNQPQSSNKLTANQVIVCGTNKKRVVSVVF